MAGTGLKPAHHPKLMWQLASTPILLVMAGAGTAFGSVARVFCPVTPAGAPARTMNFFYSGWFSTQISDLFGGMWSTGTDAEDGWVTVLSSRSGTSWRMFMEGDTVFRESIGELHACEWL